DDVGNLTIFPWEGDPLYANPLSSTLYENKDLSHQLVTNNFLVIKVPFVSGLSYRLNTGFRMSFADQATYRGRNTKAGLDARGSSDLSTLRSSNTIVENIVSYNR